MNDSVGAVTAGGESDSASQLRCLGFPAERPLRPGTVVLRAKSMLERVKIARRLQQRTAIVIERLAATAGLVTFFIVGYFGVGRSISSAMTFDMATSLDRRIPFIAQSVWIYFWVFTAALIPLFVVKCPRLFRRTVLAYGLVIAISLICFKAYPATSASLRAAGAVLDVPSPSNWAVSVLYSLDPPYNLFPSLHLSLALLAAFSAWKAKRLYGVGVGVGVGLVAVAVCTVKQHVLVDVLGGAVLASLSGGLIIGTYRAKPGVTPAYGWRGPGLYVGLLVLAYAGIYAAYLCAA
jgi:membrane-associated phospholipid phosphatase